MMVLPEKRAPPLPPNMGNGIIIFYLVGILGALLSLFLYLFENVSLKIENWHNLTESN